MGIIFDIILLAIIVIAFIIGYRKGFVKSVWKIVALIVTIVLVIALKNPTVEFLSGTSFADTIHTKISETVHLPSGGGVNISDSLNMPELIKPQIDSGIASAENAIFSVNDTAANALTSVFISIIASVGLFIIIRLLLMAAYLIVNGITEIPGIKSINKVSGGVLSAVNIIFIMFIVLALVSLFAPADSGLFEMIDTSYVVKYLYNYNILLQIFMKI